ncbi:MAG: hypothetical protein HYV60_12705 [Planctomycetia bacterium]|nr:hypothetical protein [Planctomycetia bacterium]
MLRPIRGGFGVVMGIGIVPADVEEVAEVVLVRLDEDGQFDLLRFGEKGHGVLFPLWLLKHLPNMVAAHVSIIHRAEAPNNPIVTACGAATQATGVSIQIKSFGAASRM